MQRMTTAQPGIQGSIPKITRTDPVCVEGEGLHGKRSSSVSPCSAGQAVSAWSEAGGVVLLGSPLQRCCGCTSM